MACDFHDPFHFSALARVLIPSPLGWPFNVALHCCHLRPGRGGDRVYSFYSAGSGKSQSAIGCFALYPDDILSGAAALGEQFPGAWPVLRRVHPAAGWISSKHAAEFIGGLRFFELADRFHHDGATEAWFVRFDDGRYTRLWRYSWWAATERRPAAWAAIEAACHTLAAHSLRSPPATVSRE